MMVQFASHVLLIITAGGIPMVPNRVAHHVNTHNRHHQPVILTMIVIVKTVGHINIVPLPPPLLYVHRAQLENTNLLRVAPLQMPFVHLVRQEISVLEKMDVLIVMQISQHAQPQVA